MATSSGLALKQDRVADSSSSSAVTSNDEGPPTVSLLDKLRAPKPSDFSEHIDLLHAVLCVYNCSTANGSIYLKEFF